LLLATILNNPEHVLGINTCVTQWELLTIAKALEHSHKYLYGQDFHLRTDHSLIWLLSFKNMEGKTARWIQGL
jgi:hypothetical protein